jgi:tRNA(Ile)-lysidine synthase
LALLALAAGTGRPVTAVHVDHGLRPGSAAESDVVAAAAARFGAGFVSYAVAVDAGPNLESRARQARLAALPEGAMTGHTADDQAETVLINLLRGAGLEGLAGMRATRPPARLVHPLLGLRRRDTHDLCAFLGLAAFHDPSNDDAAFVRNRIRHEVLPLLASVSGRDPVPILVRQAGLLGEDADLLAELSAAVDPLDAASLRAAPVPLARRAVRRWLAMTEPDGHPPDLATVERVLAVARLEATGCEVPGGGQVRRRGGRLRIDPPGAP